MQNTPSETRLKMITLFLEGNGLSNHQIIEFYNVYFQPYMKAFIEEASFDVDKFFKQVRNGG